MALLNMASQGFQNNSLLFGSGPLQLPIKQRVGIGLIRAREVATRIPRVVKLAA
jgi:hypothetical protein